MPFRLHWTCDDWQTVHERYAGATALDVWYLDLTNVSGTVKFAFYWPEVDKWESREFQVDIASASKAAVGG